MYVNYIHDEKGVKVLSLRGVTKKYGDFCAVDKLDFDAPEGQIVGLIGPNGAGKSTTIRMIMNILECDEGEISLDGKKFTADDSNIIGYLPEERGLYKKQKVVDVLLYLAELKGCSKQDALPKIDYWLKRFDLLEWKNKKIDSLSKGMAQKIQFISTIVHDPQILFLDEPFSGLDPVSADELLSIMNELKQSGRILLFSTHVMEQAEKICDQIIMLNHGKKILDGSMQKIRTQYGKNSITIDFSGDASAISDLSVVESVQFSGSSCTVVLHNGSTVNDLFKSLSSLITQNKFSLRSIKVDEPSLHSIFVKLAGHGGNFDEKKEGEV